MAPPKKTTTTPCRSWREALTCSPQNMETKGSVSSNSSEKQQISIAGAGNRLISHDRIGPRVLRLIRDRYGPGVELCDIGTSGLRLLDYLHDQALLIVIDACLMNEAPGTIRVIEPDLDAPGTELVANGIAGRSVLNTSIHQIGPLETLVIARRLYEENMPRRVLVIMVETRDIDAMTERAACRKVVEILDREIGLCRIQ
uniref:Hydrogenase maturation protease n=1 Tax=Candidatus Kentrum sp. TUN TaxID=2126343 RepID=A0A450ZPE1_9GAMM|nr:MAG: hydrogenase maturation protease [Candidatus Kentron sp. TUN]VFK55640.1 MAG: hydrogenase maturation protease [Candidatus Kentron sp. TUN]